jgi:HK97 gp10 family phage protein
MGDAFSIKYDTSAIDRGLDVIAEGAKTQTRPAAQAAAQVLYAEVKLRAPVAKRAKKLKSGRVIAPGALKAAIYQAYSKDRSTPERATYHVSWNYKKAPHGHLVEFGTSRAPAHPFLRPSFDSKAADALEAARTHFANGMAPVLGGK